MQMEAIQVKFADLDKQAGIQSPARSFHGKNSPQAPGTNLQAQDGSNDFAVRGEYRYSRQNINLHYKNQDGDTLELSMDVQSLNSAAEEKPVSALLKSPFHSVSEVIKQFIQKQIQKMAEISLEYKTKQVEKSEIELTKDLWNKESEDIPTGAPKTWDSGDTSERITKFSISFFGKSGKSSGEFAREAIVAVKKGVEEASGDLKDLGKEASSLVSSVQDSVIKGIEAWAAAKESEGFTASA